ncbi:metal-dependent hydrolase, partial [Phormidium sp. CCY1219]|uniref:metal-dependent hydrolase n=1 Tax=Phormidium sp. CCY1219 TaxID=2886104 RepID=UPI002D1EC8E6
MMSITHAALSSAIVPVLLSSSDPMVLGLAIVGSQLPDIDTTTSLIGQICYPISSQLEKRFPHRSATHSFVAIAAVAVAWWWPCQWLKLSNSEWLALWLGMFVSIVSDTFTVKGAQIFWPNPVWCYSGSSWDKKRLKTGGIGEMWILAIAVSIASFLLISQPFSIQGTNLVQFAGTQIGIKDAVFSQYNQFASTHIVYAQIEGVHAQTRDRMDGKYWTLGQEGGEFILSLSGDIYRTGTSGQIIIDSIKFDKGEENQIQIEAIAFDDEPIEERLEKLRSQFPDAAIFLSGTVAVDFPEDLKP